MTHNLPDTKSLKQFATRSAVVACIVLALGVLVAAVRGEARSQRTAPATVVLEPVLIEIEAQPAAATIQPEIFPIPEIPVNGRELLRDQAGTAMARAEVTPRPAPAVQLPKLNTIEMEVTAYCACKKCCGPKAQGITASGKRVNYNRGHFVAADRMYKFGTKLLIPGYANDKPVEVIDRGGAIKGNKLDVYFDSHQEALNWGRQKLTVTLVN
jgi:3D (Asp-Asp-Asp) domain-containing protein